MSDKETDIERLRRIGASLHEVDARYLADPGQQWFQGEDETDIFVWRDEGDVAPRSFQVVFGGLVVHWNRDQGLRTGRTVDSPQRGAYGGTTDKMFVRFDGNPDAAVVGGARELLRACGKVNELIELLTSDD